jgi:uncharacterized protein DUF4035
MLARTSSRELTEWQAYEREYGPLGPERGDWQAATVAHTFAALMAGKQGSRLKLTDFLLRWAGPRAARRQTPDEQLNIFRALALRQEQTNVNHRRPTDQGKRRHGSGE